MADNEALSSPAHADPEAPSTIVRSDTPLSLRVATATKQDLPDHPQSSVGAGVQDGRVPHIATPGPPAAATAPTLPFEPRSNLPFDAHSYSLNEENRAVQETVVRRGLFTAPFGEGQFAEPILNEVPAAGSSPINDSTTGGISGFPRQEQPDHPRPFTWPGVQGQPSVSSAISIIPTSYPDELSGRITVEHHITINIYSAEFREFTTKVDDLLGELRRSNEINNEVRDKLVGEITAGMAILRAPKPDPKMVDVLLIRPLKYLADKAAGPVIGATALAALAALGAALGKATGLF